VLDKSAVDFNEVEVEAIALKLWEIGVNQSLGLIRKIRRQFI